MKPIFAYRLGISSDETTVRRLCSLCLILVILELRLFVSSEGTGNPGGRSSPNIQISIGLGFAIHDVFLKPPCLEGACCILATETPLLHLLSLTTIREEKKNLPAMRLPSLNVNIPGFLCDVEQFN
jgi:hypothetical protein